MVKGIKMGFGPDLVQTDRRMLATPFFTGFNGYRTRGFESLRLRYVWYQLLPSAPEISAAADPI